MSGQMLSSSLVERLAERVSRPVGERDRDRARLHILDWTGCAIAGRAEPAGKILCGSMSRDCRGRAFAWGGLGNILEMDDVDKRGRLHPGPAIIPAILALTHEHNFRPQDILDSIVAGYEATIRLGRATGNAHYALWHSTGTCGAIGAAGACARLLKLNQDALAHALSLAVSQSAGFWQTRHEPQSMGKQLHTAHAARAGLEAALLAERGFKGPLTVLEGPQGFFAAMCGDSDPSEVLAHADSEWLIHDVSFKPWPACRHAHAAIDAALKAKEAEPSKFDWIVETYDDALVFCDKPEPTTVIEAKFSLQHAVAVALAKGPPSLLDFSIEAISDPRLAQLRKRIAVRASSRFNSRYPARFGAAVIGAGQCFEAADALGDPENPVSEGALKSKAHALIVSAGLSPPESETLIEAALACDTALFSRLSDVLQ